MLPILSTAMSYIKFSGRVIIYACFNLSSEMFFLVFSYGREIVGVAVMMAVGSIPIGVSINAKMVKIDMIVSKIIANFLSIEKNIVI